MTKRDTKLDCIIFFRNQIKYSPSEKMQTSNPKKNFTNTTKSKTDYVSRCLSTSCFKPKNSKEKLTYNDIPKIK